MWRATWNAQDDSWTHPVALGLGVNSDGTQQDPAISPDGLELIYWSSGNIQGRPGEAWRSRRSSLTDSFSDPVRVRDTHPSLNLLSLHTLEFYSSDGLGAVFITVDQRTLIACFRPTTQSAWRQPTRSEALLPFGSSDSPAAGLIVIERNRNSLWQMHLQKSSTTLKVEENTLGSPMTTDTVTESTDSPVGTQAAEGETELDLLSVVNVAEGTIPGQWSLVDGSLTSQIVPNASLETS